MNTAIAAEGQAAHIPITHYGSGGDAVSSGSIPNDSGGVRFNAGEAALGGLAAGVVGTVLGFPLDVIKTRMQTSTVLSGGRKPGMVRMGLSILRNEGLRNMYKGLGPPLISLSIVNTLSFTSYSYFREYLGGTDGFDYRNALSGMVGAPLFGIITTPENFLKTQMQLDNVNASKGTMHKGGGRFQSSFQCANALISARGPTVLYTGHVINTIREGAFVGCYFYCYEGYRQHLKDLLGGVEIAVPVAGGLAGASAWAASFPLDCIRAGLQGRPVIADEGPSRIGAVGVFKELLRTKGVLGLYAGVGPSITRAFLVSGSRFSAYEGAMWLCRGERG